MDTLVRSELIPDDDVESLRRRVASLEAVLTERSADLGQVKSSLDAFKIRYRQDVGLLHEALDELEQAIDEAEQGERAKRPRNEHRDPTASPANPNAEALPRYTSDAVRKLFREAGRCPTDYGCPKALFKLSFAVLYSGWSSTALRKCAIASGTLP